MLIPGLMKRGINEAYFYNVAGSPIGRKSMAGVADSFDVEQFHVVVSADQAENILILSIVPASYRSRIKDS